MLSDSVESFGNLKKLGECWRNRDFFAGELARCRVKWYHRSMSMQTNTKKFLLDQCARYPALRPQDLLKGLHQSAFGCGHFVTDEAFGMELLQRELVSPGTRADIEPLDGDYCRVHLGYLTRTGLAPETLFRLFVLSAEAPMEDTAALEEKLTGLLELAKDGRLPFALEEVQGAAANWRDAGFPACHHSPEFRAAYTPAYRVIRKDFVWVLPLLAAIDRKLVEKSRAVVAIEGGSASGKSTLGTLLERIYDCNLFHMDDFFLRPEQRTAERLAEPGGNVDRERFYEEILRPLTQGQPVQYRRYDCHTQTVQAPVSIAPKALSIVEGAYSLHPALADCYDLSAFLQISPELQRARILKRNSPEFAERFFSAWIPLELTYFEAANTMERCDLILEVEA